MDDIRERVQSADMPTDANEDITTSDGAVRQLEKNDEMARVTGAGKGPDDPRDTDWNTVIPLGKETGGAPEEEAADAEDTAGAALPPAGAR